MVDGNQREVEYRLPFQQGIDQVIDVVCERDCELAPIKTMLEALSSDRLAREIDQLCGYSTDQMGKVLAHFR